MPLLFDLEGVHVVTTNARVAEHLDSGGVAVRLTGGDLVHGTGEMTGDSVLHAFEKTQVDWAMVEVDGVHPFAGFTVDSPWRVANLRAVMGAGERRCVLAGSSAFDRRRIGFVAEISVADLLITDELLDDGSLPAYEGRVVRTPIDTREFVPEGGA